METIGGAFLYSRPFFIKSKALCSSTCAPNLTVLSMALRNYRTTTLEDAIKCCTPHYGDVSAQEEVRLRLPPGGGVGVNGDELPPLRMLIGDLTSLAQGCHLPRPQGNYQGKPFLPATCDFLKHPSLWDFASRRLKRYNTFFSGFVCANCDFNKKTRITSPRAAFT